MPTLSFPKVSICGCKIRLFFSFDQKKYHFFAFMWPPFIGQGATRNLLVSLFGRVVALVGIPFGIHQIVFGYLYIHLLGFLRFHHFDEFCGLSSP